MMRVVYNLMGQSAGGAFEVHAKQVFIGRDPQANDLVLAAPAVPKQAAVLSSVGEAWELGALGEGEVLVDGRLIPAGERVRLLVGQEIRIFPYVLRLESRIVDDGGERLTRDALDRDASALILEVHRRMLGQSGVDESASLRRDDDEAIAQMERNIEEHADLLGLFEPPSRSVLSHLAAENLRSELAASVAEEAGAAEPLFATGNWARLQTQVPDLEGQINALVKQFIVRLALGSIEDVTAKVEHIEARFADLWDLIAKDVPLELLRYLASRHLKKQLKDLMLGFGPLEDLLRMPNVSEIMVVDADRIYIEKRGTLEKSGRRFVSNAVTQNIISRIVDRVGGEINRSSPLADARLMDGSRVNAIIPPLAVSGPCLTIRRFPRQRLTIDDLTKTRGSLTVTAARFLRAAVVFGCNILVSGGTGSGKTTLLNCLSNFIPDKERIVTVEDTAELQLQKEHVVRLEARTKNAQGAGAINIERLVKNSLRMRPDRIVVGECRGEEALDMLQAMNTGHDGSMTTIHANTPSDVILRLEVLVRMGASNLPVDSIRRQIASAIDLVVQLTRFPDGSRKVTHITEFVDYDEREGRIRTKDLFLLEGGGETAELAPTGILPTFMGDLIKQGLIDLDAFYL